MRHFNTAGPVRPDLHYMVPPLSRFNLEEVLSLIHQEKYFILHAPRQTGKTSCLLALMKLLNDGGQYRALYANIEGAQADRESISGGMATIVDSIGSRAETMLGETESSELAAQVIASTSPTSMLRAFLTKWCQTSSKPSILLLDEVDALVGDTLISLLRQLRSGYDQRPQSFPQCIILCGVRDVRDYRIHSSSQKTIITGGSAFNIRAESLRLGDFSLEEVNQLYGEHTKETGQVFQPGAVEVAWDLSAGQPWVVNALAYQACFKDKGGRDRAQPITAESMESARERLILDRVTHLDQLVDKLQEDRVRRVVEPILAGETLQGHVRPDDIDYVLDLGLIRRSSTGYEIANALYREVIPRELTWITQGDLLSQFQTRWYVLPDGRLDVNRLLTAFQEFFRENFEHWLEGFDYKEAGPQLLLQAFLQTIVNGGGRIAREYAAGRGRVDLLLIWPVGSDTILPGTPVQKVVIEFKVVGVAAWKKSVTAQIGTGIEQALDYMDRCGTGEGHLLICDRDPTKTWEEKVWQREEEHSGKTITIWGM